MKRLSAKRVLVALLCAVVCVVIVLNLNHASPWREHKRPPWKENGIGLQRVQTVPPAASQLNVPSLTYAPMTYGVNPVPEGVLCIENDTSKLPYLPVWPQESDTDRVVEQLNYAPTKKPSPALLKTVYVQTGLKYWGVSPGRHVFQEQKCRVDTCQVTDNRHDAGHMDAVLFRNQYSPHAMNGFRRTRKQVWIWYQLECPYHSQWLGKAGGVFNWTATYRHDSDIVTPYQRFQPYRMNVLTKPLERNYALNKTKNVAWFVSNCGSRNNRLTYATELGRYIDVDIFGNCGQKTCPRSKHKQCMEMLNKEYKFYLSFENSNCKDYITEKFFDTGLG